MLRKRQGKTHRDTKAESLCKTTPPLWQSQEADPESTSNNSESLKLPPYAAEMLERKDEKALMNPKNRAPLTETDLTPHYDSRAYKVQPGVEPLREQRTSRENFQRQNRTK